MKQEHQEHPFKFGDKVMFIKGSFKGRWGVVTQLLPRGTTEEKLNIFSFVVTLCPTDKAARFAESTHAENTELEKLPDNYFA